MPKTFYYFKFIATEWLTGNIAFESLAVQGLFINICALYWQRSGKLSLEEVKERYKNPVELQKLVEKYFILKKTEIKIKFLDEQMLDTNRISKVNKPNGLKGGRPKKEENPIGSESVYKKKQVIVRSIVKDRVEVEAEITTTPLDDIFLTIQKLRPELPIDILTKERAKFETIYPNKKLPKDNKLVIAWAERINYTPKKSSQAEFEKIAAQNKEKYGA